MTKKGTRRVRTGLHRNPRKRQSGRSVVLLIGAFFVVALAMGYLPTWLKSRTAIRNVLLITLDGARTDLLGCYGAEGSSTPNLDRLSGEGVRFARCSTASPLALPSHATILTSTVPIVHGVRSDAFSRLAEESETLAEVLQRAGYQTVAVTASATLQKTSGLDQGFSPYDDGSAGGTAGTAGTSGTGGTSGTNGTSGEGGERPQETVMLSDWDRPARAVTDRAIEALGSFADQPYLLWVQYAVPDPVADSSSMDAEASLPVAERPAASPRARREAAIRELATIDTEVGRLIETLDGTLAGKRTLVVLVGSRGAGLGDHDEIGAGYLLYETTTSVPFILRCPGKLPSGRVVDKRVRTVDVLPTALEYVSRPRPLEAQGQSLRTLVLGTRSEWKPVAYAETDAPLEVFGLASLRSVIEGEWKYIDSPEPELYNLVSDPEESTNLAAERRDLVDSMRARLKSFLLAATRTPSGEDRAVTVSEQDRELLGSLDSAAGAAVVPTSGGGAETAAVRAAPARHSRAIRAYTEAVALMRAGRYDDAEGQLRQVLQALPDAPRPRRDLDALLDQRSGGRAADPTGQR